MLPGHDINIYFPDMLPILVLKIPGNGKILVQKWGAFSKCEKGEVYLHLGLLNLTNL